MLSCPPLGNFLRNTIDADDLTFYQCLVGPTGERKNQIRNRRCYSKGGSTTLENAFISGLCPIGSEETILSRRFSKSMTQEPKCTRGSLM